MKRTIQLPAVLMFAMAITAGCSQLTNNQAKEENLSEIATDNTTDIAIDNTTDNSTSGIHEYKELLSVPYGEDGLVFAENEHSACAKSGSEELLKNISDGSVKYYKMLERGATKPDSDAMTPELHIDGSHFDLHFKKFSSYAGAGEFTISGNTMTALTDDGKYTFVFNITDEGNLVFDIEESRKASSEIAFGDLYDEAIFMPVFSAD